MSFSVRTIVSSVKAAEGSGASATLMKRKGGGQLVVFESLFNTPAIGKLIRQGDWEGIPASMKTGRAYGQVQFTDALITHIQEGRLEPMEAYLKCPGVYNPLNVIPNDKEIPLLLNRVYPCHEVVKIDLFIPGCPPPADAIWSHLVSLLSGRPAEPDYKNLKYD